MMIAHTWPAFYQEINTHIIITLFYLSRSVPVFEKLCLFSIHIIRAAFVWIQTFYGLNCIKANNWLSLLGNKSHGKYSSIYFIGKTTKETLFTNWLVLVRIKAKIYGDLSCYERMNKAAYVYFKRLFKTIDKFLHFGALAHQIVSTFHWKYIYFEFFQFHNVSLCGVA